MVAGVERRLWFYGARQAGSGRVQEALNRDPRRVPRRAVGGLVAGAGGERRGRAHREVIQQPLNYPHDPNKINDLRYRTPILRSYKPCECRDLQSLLPLSAGYIHCPRALNGSTP